MKPHSSYSAYILGVIKDFLIIALLFTALCFIDTGVAAFISVTTTAILLTRRIILDFNPGFTKGHHIAYKENEIIIDKGVEVFDISKVPTMEYLQRYMEIMMGILNHPAALIIRFTGILRVEEFDLYILAEVVGRLQKSGIAVIFSDVKESLQLQFREFGIENNLACENICCNVSDAFAQASKSLHRTTVK